MSRDDVTAVDRALPGPPRDAPVAPEIPVPDRDRHVERLPLAVPVRGPNDPSGVDLSDVLAAARSMAPAVSSVAVQGGTLTIISDRPLEPAERSELTALLADSDRLARPKAAASTAVDLTQVLLDETTGDQAWLRAFRRYAVTHLIPREGKQE